MIHCMAHAPPANRWKLAVMQNFKSLHTVMIKYKPSQWKTKTKVWWSEHQYYLRKLQILSDSSFGVGGKGQPSLEREEELEREDSPPHWRKSFRCSLIDGIGLSGTKSVEDLEVETLPWWLQQMMSSSNLSEKCKQDFSHMLLKCWTLSSPGIQKIEPLYFQHLGHRLWRGQQSILGDQGNSGKQFRTNIGNPGSLFLAFLLPCSPCQVVCQPSLVHVVNEPTRAKNVMMNNIQCC